MLGNRTRGGRMEGANESTELWRHPHLLNILCHWKRKHLYTTNIAIGVGWSVKRKVNVGFKNSDWRAVVVVSMLAFDSDDPSSNPAEVYSFYSVYCLKRTKINKKRPGMAHFLKKELRLVVNCLRSKTFFENIRFGIVLRSGRKK